MIKKLYIAGTFVETKEKLTVTNPFDNSIVGETFLAGKEELNIAIEKAKQDEKEISSMPSYRKYKALQLIAHEILNRKKEMATVLAGEAGKPMKYAIGEIDRAAQTFIEASEESKRMPGEILSIDRTPSGAGKEGYIKYFPVGLVAGIAPFNFPLNLAVHKIAPAIATGCPIILKPARSTPLSVLLLAEIIAKADLPKGILSVLPMDRQAGNQLVTDERIKKLSFTGSPEVGWAMKAQAGKKRITLELGGNAGVIVSNTTDIETAVNKCVVGSFAYSGQVCIHVQRIYVHEQIFDAFIEKFVAKVNQLKSGDPLSADTDISAMIDEWNAKRVEEWVNDAVKDGAKILTGGKRECCYYAPTVLTNTKKQMNVCSLEIFGPVVSVEKYSDFNEAVKEVDSSEFGLQAGIFTDKISEMNQAFNNIEVGGVIINDIPTFRVDHMPYGGVKNSGFGREGVKYAMMEMLEPRLLVKNSGL